jgi:transposase InsO family protein
MPGSKHLTHGISNLVSLITKTKLGLSLGPFPKARGGYRFLIVAIDTFTKWVEAELVRRITKENTVKFLHGIVMHFGVPNRLISDNGTQFISKKFENFCAAYGIKHPRSSVNHLMTNGNVKRANGIILQGIKT